MSQTGKELSAFLQQQNDMRKPKSASAPRPYRAPKFGGGPKVGGGARFNPGGKITAPPPKPSGGGWSWNPIHDAVQAGKAVEHAGLSGEKWVHSKSDLAAHDVAAMPAGFVLAGKAIGHDSAKLAAHLGGGAEAKRLGKGKYETPGLGKAMVKQTYDSVRHPARDPFQGFLTASMLASMGASGVARVGAAGDAFAAAGEDASALGRAGAAAKALGKKPIMPERIVKYPQEIEKNGKLVKKESSVQFTASQNPLLRGMEHLHDKIIERKLAQENVGARDLLRKYAYRRVGASDAEVARRTENTAGSLPLQIQHAGSHIPGTKFGKFGKALTRHEGEWAMTLRSWNVLPHEAAHYFHDAINTSNHPDKAMELSDLSQTLHQKGVLEVKRGRVVVNKKLYPELHAADKLVKNGQNARNAVIEKYGLLPKEFMNAREALPAEVLRSEAARGADGVRQGNGWTDLSLSHKQMARFPRPAAITGNVIGTVRNILRKGTTGEGIRQGLVPDDLTGNTARALREAQAYEAKFEARARAYYDRGYKVARNHDDVYIRNPDEVTKALSVKAKEDLGQQASTLDTLPDNGIQKNVLEHFHDFLHPREAGHAGAVAEGTGRFVPKEVVRDLSKSIAPRGSFSKRIDNLNSWITGLTVYAKLSHIPQRGATNATTSLLSGALTSPASHALLREIDKRAGSGAKVDMAQATGTHGYLALPNEGTGMGSRFASSGANFYARHLDSYFRRLNLVHEARKVGIDTPAKIDKLIKYAKDPSRRIPIKEARQYEQVLRRADRVSMMYDGLTATERGTVSRYMWFYPWTKAAARYGGHVATEHPIFTAGAIAAGKQGEAWQKHAFGRLPSYEYGLIPFGHNLSSSAGWLTPFNTTSQVIGLASRPQGVVQNLNPVFQAGLTAASGLNSFGDTIPGGPGYPSLNTAVGELFSPTPEMGILKDYLDAKSAERKTHMFPHSPNQDWLTKLILGPAWTKRTNKQALHKAHDRETGGLYDILVHKKK